MKVRVLLLKFSLSSGVVYKIHAFFPTQDKTSYREYVKKVMRVPRKRLSPKVMKKTFMDFSTVINKERLNHRIKFLSELPGAEVMIENKEVDWII